MGLEDIREKILADARKEANDIRTRAEETRRRILEDAKREAEKIEKSFEERAKRDAETEIRAAEVMARLDGKKTLLRVKRDILSRIFEEAENKLANLEKDRYLSLMGAVMLKAVETGSEEVVISDGETKIDEGFIEEVNEKLREAGKKGNLRLSSRRGNFKGGFILVGEGVDVNCTVEALVATVREKIEPEVVSKLLEGIGD